MLYTPLESFGSVVSWVVLLQEPNQSDVGYHALVEGCLVSQMVSSPKSLVGVQSVRGEYLMVELH